jgi:hypothetical protein
MSKCVRLALAAGIALAQAGCFAGYAYPTLDHVSGVRVDAPPDEVFVVRADHRIVLGSQNYCPSAGTRCRLRPLPTGEVVPAQFGVGLARRFCFWGPMFGGSDYRGHKVTVRLYRRGYETVELLPWDYPAGVAWKPATALYDQVRAIDRLIDPSPGTAGYSSSSELPQRPGSVAEGHRRVLLFAADEYDRLARQLPDDADGRAEAERVRTRAAALRKRAAE